MEQTIKLSRSFWIICIICICIGAGAFVYGFLTDSPRTWANYLLNNFYFFLLSIGSAFFLALQSITKSGWSSGFRRIAEAMMLYVPAAGVFFILLYFGMNYIYPWTNNEIVSTHEIIQHKTPYLNIPFFFIRIVIFFTIWTLLIMLIRKSSLNEDKQGGLLNFNKIEKYSGVFIFFLAISFSLLAFDLLMSIEVEWFSTIFALKNFISAFQHSVALIFIIVILLNRKGYFEFLNISHVHDFARYIFIVSIFYGYFWFSQFMLTWYSNIPEETIYYAKRWTTGWKIYWISDIVINWAIPFIILLPVFTSRNKVIVFSVAIILIIGLWIELFVSIFPGIAGSGEIGFIELGSFAGFAGLFALITGYSLSKAPIVPIRHPFIQESYNHHFESYI